MNGVHDMGGMQGFGPVAPEPDEPIFHAAWERDVLAMTLAIGARGAWNLDQSRSARESIPPADYLSIGYYKIWLTALENLLHKYQLLSDGELQRYKEDGYINPKSARLSKPLLTASMVAPALAAGSPVNRASQRVACFKPGQTVWVKNINPSAHTRLPRYIRGKPGIVHVVHGCHIYPDSHAQGAGEQPQWLYNVRFSAASLWGSGATGFVHVDCWEPYLSRVNESSAGGIHDDQ